MKRILVLTASIGSGHSKAAEAITMELRRLLPDAEIITVDFMARRISIIHAFMKWIYLAMLAIVPNLYDIVYHFAGANETGKGTRIFLSYIMLPAMKRLYARYQPDIVVCTHPFPEGAASLLHVKKNFFLATVMTDYSLHQIWLSHHVDCYFMATHAMKMRMIAEGFSKEKLFAVGIPIANTLFSLPEKEEVRNAFAIPRDAKTLLLMGGGLGIGGIEKSLKMLESIEEGLLLIVVAGHNNRLKEKILDFASESHHTILVFVSTDCVHQLMKASDLLITKPGALTMSEAFSLGLPMLLHDPIPGPETDNAIYATRHGAAVWLHPKESLANAVKYLFSGDVLDKMACAAKRAAKPEAAGLIASYIINTYCERDDAKR